MKEPTKNVILRMISNLIKLADKTGREETVSICIDLDMNCDLVLKAMPDENQSDVLSRANEEYGYLMYLLVWEGLFDAEILVENERDLNMRLLAS